MTEKRFKSRCYEKEKNVVIYDDGNKLFDVSYRDFDDAYYLKRKLIPVIDKLNELAEENEQSKMMIATLRNIVLEQEDLEKENKELKRLLKKVIDERVIDYPLLQELKKVIMND